MLNLIEHHEIERRLRKIEDYPTRTLAVMLIQAKCYDERIRPQFEDEARRLISKLAGDNDAIFSLTKLVGGAHLGAYRFAERTVTAQRLEQGRIKKQADDLEEQLRVAEAVKIVTDRKGTPRESGKKRRGKFPISDSYVKSIEGEVSQVYKTLNPPDPENPEEPPKGPSKRGIRRTLKLNDDAQKVHS